ncbi:MAG TPA: hypothetical protein ENI93_06715 [Gammaproteobacteria bacterium]|nr:hypothetical protein [Gammaproteobacteria bacterium]
MLKEILSTLAIGLTLLAFLPYVLRILSGAVRPHVFSWIIWGTTTCIVFLAQLDDGGGIGAWPIGVSGLMTMGIAVLAWARRGDITITRLDWAFFLTALLSLPFWVLTRDPLWAVIILTGVDVLGFGPTLRKSWHFPHQENILFFLLFLVRNVLVILALEHHSLTTVLFPATIAFACLLLILLVAWRRRVLEPA